MSPLVFLGGCPFKIGLKGSSKESRLFGVSLFFNTLFSCDPANKRGKPGGAWESSSKQGGTKLLASSSPFKHHRRLPNFDTTISAPFFRECVRDPFPHRT